MQQYIKIHPKDDVAVALLQLEKGTSIILDDVNIKLTEKIEAGHKFAVRDISSGEDVIKYGYKIGTATTQIEEGSHVHTHNIKTGLSDIVRYEYTPDILPLTLCGNRRYFSGYRRSDGKVGIRNEVWIIPTVGCVNNLATALAKRSSNEDVVAFTHSYGCSQMGDDQENTKQILANLVNHPNAGGVLVLGLGCENSNIDELKKLICKYDSERVRFLQCQDVEDEISEGMKILSELLAYTSKFKRESIDISELVIGLKCGGSDGLSGITANPTVGSFSNMLISHGGSTILTEVPEMFGAETILMNRSSNREVFEKTVKLINNFKNYFTSHNQVIYDNPSPGNKSGGISTLEDKSLGCTQKSGSAVVVDVLGYGEKVSKKGLNLLCSPGNDLVATTALAAAGAHIVLFTTGRGTPFASPVPTVKLSSNSSLNNKKSNWIDFDCGKMLSGNNDIAKELFDYIIEVANGTKAKSEIMGYHDMAIWKQGVTL